MDADPWFLWVIRMLVGVGVFFAGYLFGRHGVRPGGDAAWTLDDLRSVRRKIQEAGALAFVELTPAEMAAYMEVTRIMMAEGVHRGRLH